MDTLYLYACSHGKFGSTVKTDYPKWEDTNSFGHVLAEQLNVNFINRSWPGACNFHIFKRLMKDIMSGTLKPTDIVIVQWTYIARAFYTDQTKTVMPTKPEFKDYYINYYDDLQSLCNLLTFNFYVKNKIKCRYFFSIANTFDTVSDINPGILEEFVNDKVFVSIENKSPLEYVYSLNKQELVLPCNHLSEQGHITLAKVYFDAIKNNGLPKLDKDAR